MRVDFRNDLFVYLAFLSADLDSFLIKKKITFSFEKTIFFTDVPQIDNRRIRRTAVTETTTPDDLAKTHIYTHRVWSGLCPRYPSNRTLDTYAFNALSVFIDARVVSIKNAIKLDSKKYSLQGLAGKFSLSSLKLNFLSYRSELSPRTRPPLGPVLMANY